MTTKITMLTDRDLEFVLHGEWQAERKTPCDECPWRRNSVPGHTGPSEPQNWVDQAHADGPIYCHKTITEADMSMDDPRLRQCAGAARFRANVCKSPRNPTAAQGPADRENIFTSNQGFLEHHE